MFSDVNMVSLHNFSFEMNIKFARLFSCFTNYWIFEIKLWSEIFIKLFGSFLLQMQLYKKITFHKIADFASVLVIKILLKLLLKFFVNIFMNTQNNCLFLCDYSWMLFSIESISHNDLVSLSFVSFAFFLILHTSNKYYTHKIHWLCFIMDNFAWLEILCCYFFQDCIHNNLRNIFKDL